MKDMVNTFSEYARSPVTSPEFMNINRLIQEVVDLYSTLDEQGLIEMQLNTDIPDIKADSGRLRQVFNNLLKNAFDAMAGQPDTRLIISTQRIIETGVDFIEIRIKDTGTGITEDIIGNIFEPYVTTKIKGTGLGLAIVKKIIEEHGGIVWMENNTDTTGASAVIRLPMATSEYTDNMQLQVAKNVS
jgi:nitrogen fixation/metabolism regulation signal transduction histidine kinase